MPRTALETLGGTIARNPSSVNLLNMYASQLRMLGRTTDAAEVESRYAALRFDDAGFIAGVKAFVTAGEEARFVPELPLKLVIIDETIVMFGMRAPVAGPTAPALGVRPHPSPANHPTLALDAVRAVRPPLPRGATPVTAQTAHFRGGPFAPAAVSAAVPPTIWGTVTFTFPDCGHMKIVYNGDASAVHGPTGNSTAIYARVADVNGLVCQ